MSSALNRITATGVILATSKTGEVGNVVLTPAAALATLVLRKGGASGTVLISLQAAANGSSVAVKLNGAVFDDGVHATLTGAGAEATIELV